jgi:hypothetical protein
MIGKELSPVLVEIEDALWEFELNSNLQPEYTTDGFRAATKIAFSIGSGIFSKSMLDFLDLIYSSICGYFTISINSFFHSSIKRLFLIQAIKLASITGRVLGSFVKLSI